MSGIEGFSDDERVLVSAMVTAAVLAQHFDALTLWPRIDQPVLLPWAIVNGENPPECTCGMRHGSTGDEAEN